MKTLTEITNIIAKQIGEVAKTAATDYDIIVCPERIFMDDYLPEEERYLQAIGELPSLDVDSPRDLPYKNTIFVVIKMGSGQANMGVANYSCTLQVLSEADDFTAARQLLDSFIAEYNFEYIDGIVQSYFTPDMGGSQESVYTGFRALMSCRGNVRVPEEGVAFVTDILASFDGKLFFEIPFLNVMYNHSCQPDPQAFAGTNGRTMALNRQSTQTITLEAYLWNKGAERLETSHKYDIEDFAQTFDYMLDKFSASVIGAHSKMNAKFKLLVRTSIKTASPNKEGSNISKLISGKNAGNFVKTNEYALGSTILDVKKADTLYYNESAGTCSIAGAFCDEEDGKKGWIIEKCEPDNRMCIFDDWFILTNAAYNQAWGDVSSWSLTFTSALEEEK